MQDMQTKRIFAWWPKRVTSGKLVWLDWYYENILYYDPTTFKPPAIGYCYSFTETKHENIIRILKR